MGYRKLICRNFQNSTSFWRRDVTHDVTTASKVITYYLAYEALNVWRVWKAMAVKNWSYCTKCEFLCRFSQVLHSEASIYIYLYIYLSLATLNFLFWGWCYNLRPGWASYLKFLPSIEVYVKLFSTKFQPPSSSGSGVRRGRKVPKWAKTVK